MKQSMRRLLGMICATALLFSMMLTVIPFSSAATVVPRAVQIQWTDQWKSVYYGGQHLYDTGCGIFATVNAIGYVTGNEMSITEVADWAYEIKALNYYAGGTDRTILYPKLQARFGEEYGFTVDCAGATGYWQNANATLRNHLLKGGVAIGHVYGHFIAVVGYDASTGYYHVYDSAPSTARDTGNGDAWVSESWFTTSTYFTLDWFCLVTATGNPINRDYGATDTPVDTTTTADKLGTYKINTAQLNVREGVGVGYDVVTTVKQDDLVNVTALSDGWGQFVAPDGKQGWANVTYYGQYIGVDALAATKAIAWGDVSSSVDAQGRLTLVNNSQTGMAGYDFKLPFAIGTATTPYFETAVGVNNDKGFFFGLSNGGAYYMMRDCTSGDALVEATQAPYMTGDERITVNLAEWWKPSGGERIKAVRFYLAPGASITIEYLYFAAAASMVSDTSYNLETFTAVNETLLNPAGLYIPDRSKNGGYTYQNGVLTVQSNEADSYAVAMTLNKSVSPEQLSRLLFSVDTDVRYNIDMTVTTSQGDATLSLVADYAPELCTATDGGYLPAAKQTAGLNFASFYTYNALLPADGVSTVKTVVITLGGKGTLVLDNLQVANSDVPASFADGQSASDTTPDLPDEPEEPVYAMGDVNGNGDITTSDARVVMLYALEGYALTGPGLAAADFNGDGEVNTSDARLVMLYALTH